MASAASSCASLPLEQLALYHAVDPVLSSIFVFHGPATTANSTLNSSRIQVHIFAADGLQSYPRITVSPAAPLYAAVNHLPRERQGDEVYRGLAVCLFKYFSEIPDSVKSELVALAHPGRPSSKPLQFFDELHAADLADKMEKVENPAAVVRDLKDAFADRVVPWVDIDLVVPTGTITVPTSPGESSRQSLLGYSESSVESPIHEKFADRFGKLAPLVDSLGEPTFLPTSKLRRAPSKPSNLSKSKLFSAAQKEALRLSMCEFVDTEERYVHKMYDLVHNVAHEFCQKARAKAPTSTSPDESALAKLFPPCLNEILEVNMGFLDAIRLVLEETEKDALEDLSQDTMLDPSAFPRDPTTGRRNDLLGAIAFAQCLLDWLPRFSKPYGQYMHAHTGFYSLLNSFLGDQNSSFSKRVYETGEQRMRSLLMEPIQRLPRYSLLIDTMTASLPSMHPAVKSLLKARDTVTEICSLDSYSASDHSQTLIHLRKIVHEWPESVAPAGRLITAVDVYTLLPPFRSGSSGTRGQPGILLLFADCLVFLTKHSESKWTARGLCAEIDKARADIDTDGTELSPPLDLMFGQHMLTTSIRCSQSRCGRILYLVPARNFIQNKHLRSHNIILTLELTSTYEGKATKLIEEITKAKIEGRFPEHYREQGKWSLHTAKGAFGNLGAMICVFEHDETEPDIPKFPSSVKLIVDATKETLADQLKSGQIEVVASIFPMLGGSRFRMDLDSVVGTPSSDTFSAEDFTATLSKRITTLLCPLSQSPNPLLTEIILQSNFNILRVVAQHILGASKGSKAFRPPSPTKLLSTLWSASQPKNLGHAPSKSLPSLPALSNNVPTLQPQSSNASLDDVSPQKLPHGGISIPDGTASPLEQLEETFTAYILAIRSRSGNIVGRVLRSRDRVDTAAVNELYNILLEDPTQLQAAAESPVDMLIVAFETFLDKAWKEKFGPIIPQTSLLILLAKFDALFPGDFEDYFHGFLSEMSPQTRRALTALIQLLAQLLNDSGNDGDRGALTDVFSEILTEDGDARKTIPLLDRLVEDFERLFDESGPTASEGHLAHEINRGLLAPGSIGSNASSFRKRFGFGLSRENSIKDGEGKVSSIIRSLSKSKGVSENDVLSKNSLMRSKSTDTDNRLHSLLRPRSRDRPLMQTIFAQDEEVNRPTSSNSSTQPSLASIVENPVVGRTATPRKKRRSSLSDLKDLPTADIAPLFSNREFKKPPNILTSAQTPEPATPPTKSLGLPIHSAQHTPIQNTPPTRIASPVRQIAANLKENVPPPSPRTTLADRSTNTRQHASTISMPLRRRADSTRAGTPSKIAGPREKPTRPSSSDGYGRRLQAQSNSPPKPQKLRMQTPQKLRERVLNERKAIASAESSLQAELASVTEELMSTSPSRRRPLSSAGAQARPITSPPAPTSSNALLQRVRMLENKLSALTSNLGARAASLENDLENSLLVSEKRARKLDELYREAGKENEALYERFNNELSKMAREIRLGVGEEALRNQLKDALDEVARVKKENMRLKREIGGLKAQQIGDPSS
ncbi:hypothetical protein H109_01872 [Trichophyton interdigitale MR816]|uniref:DH domain-containing protein n=1 Tax=Trichophyton interdigitale (strain MR816) TaxID=1215338 RepID=A0A059JF65_TRIIM|nr:hypothetical protein H101_00065 [Trichophyton interdigitale H6]KDB26298.1 hypothetical protein H109_01872 [Trichophyton interdigitale MR816]